MASEQHAAPNVTSPLVRRHLVLGWLCLCVFLTLGIVLDALHAFKVGWYVDLSNSTRRLMWTLAHAHGVLLGLVNIAFAVTEFLLPGPSGGRAALASACLMGGSVLLPGGFLLGGLKVYAGDPGLGILLTPIGAGLLFVAVLLVLQGIREQRRA